MSCAFCNVHDGQCPNCEPKPAPPEVPAPDELSLALTRLRALILVLPFGREQEMARDAEDALIRYVRAR